MKPVSNPTEAAGQGARSTLIKPDLKSGAAWIASADVEIQNSFLDSLTEP